MKDKKDKKILITGASGGIGNSIIEKFFITSNIDRNDWIPFLSDSFVKSDW